MTKSKKAEPAGDEKADQDDRENGSSRKIDLPATIDQPAGRPNTLRTMFLPEDHHYDVLPGWADNVQPVGCLACKSGKWLENSYFLGKTFSCDHIFTNHECDGTFTGAHYIYFLERLSNDGNIPKLLARNE